MKLYESESLGLKPIDYTGIVTQFFADKQWTLVNNSFFIAPEAQFQGQKLALRNGDGSLVENNINVQDIAQPFLQEFGLIAGKLQNQHEAQNTAVMDQTSLDFVKQLIALQRETFVLALDLISEHLGGRSTGDTVLFNHPVVARDIGLAAANIKTIEVYESLPVSELAELSPARKILTETADLMIKLMGGRAVLRGNMVQMKHLFDLVNNLYLESETCIS